MAKKRKAKKTKRKRTAKRSKPKKRSTRKVIALTPVAPVVSDEALEREGMSTPPATSQCKEPTP